MAQVVDSAQWTGISTDPFAVLSTEERQGVVQYDATSRKFFKIFAVLGAFALASVLIVTLAAGGNLKPSSSNKISSRVIEQAFEKLGVGHDMAATIVGIIFLGLLSFAMLAIHRRMQTGKAASAPLIISGTHLSVGDPSRKILLRDVSAVRFQPTVVFSKTPSQPAFPAPVAPNKYPRLEVHYGKSEPLILDLAVLNGNADRIAAVVQYRVLKARGELNG
jgi:hypothetical protein